MLEGGGKTPILTPLELEGIGFKLVAYPLSLIGVSIRAMQVTCLPFFPSGKTFLTDLVYWQIHINIIDMCMLNFSLKFLY